MLSIRKEIIRKLIHISSLWIPFIIYLLPREQAALIILLVLSLVLAYEMLRRQQHSVARLLHKHLGSILRPHELQDGAYFTGASYVLIAALIVVILFSPQIAITALSVMLIADAAAAVVGRAWGSPWINGKSKLGCSVFFITAYTVVIAIYSLFAHIQGDLFHLFNFKLDPIELFAENPLFLGLIVAACTTIVELFANKLRIDDNLAITLAAAFALAFPGYLMQFTN